MRAEHRRLVETVFPELLERAAFLFATPAPDEEVPRGGSSYYAARVRFSGLEDGILTLVVDAALGPELAASCLGIDVEDERALTLALDAVGEVANVTCGHLLRALVGPAQACEVRAPDTSILDGGGYDAFRVDEDTVAFLVGDDPVLLHLHLDREADA